MSGFNITLTATHPERDLLVADLWDAGTTGITEDEHWIRAFFDEGADSAALLRQFADFHPHLEPTDDVDWVEHSHSLWQPFEVGDRFWLVPEWLDEPAPGGRLRLPIRPGLACGSGWHPATRLCLMALEQHVKPGQTVLDVGTGSGILAEAARLLGAAHVIGCDIDHDATLVARRNLPDLAVFTGSLRSVRDAAIDVTVANLNTATIGMIAKDLARTAKGSIILSGFKEDEHPKLPRPAVQTLELEDWSCIVC